MRIKLFQKQVTLKRRRLKFFFGVTCFYLASFFVIADEEDLFGDLFYNLPEDIIVADADLGRQFEETGEDFFGDLFYNPPEDIVVTETDIDHRRQFEESETITIRRSFSSTAASSVGWSGYPKANNLSEGFEATAGAVAEARLSFMARPSPIFNMGGSLYTEIDYKNGIPDWTDIIVDELYADYILLDKIFFRMGKFPMKWGNGRLFTPGDLMALSERGLSFRANFPTVMNGLTLVALANRYYMESPDAGFSIPEDLVSAALLEKVFGNVLLSLGGRFQDRDGLKTLASVKTVAFRTDVFTDFILCYDNDDNIDFQAVTGFFREWEKLMIYGEYFFNGLTDGNKDHNVGLAMGYKKIFSSPVDVGIEWRHAFIDNSGRVFPGISFSPWQHIRMNFGIPILYGDEETRMILEDRDEYDKEDISYYMPSKQGISFLFSIGLSYSF